MEQESQLAQLGLFDARVPRYTSYPPATQFKPDIGPDVTEAWQAEIPKGAIISLYMHVPFCRRLCWFCACRTQGTQSDDPVRAYTEDLLAELRILRSRLPSDIHLSRLHWGGGTPTLLPPDQMRRLAGAVFDAFPLAQGAEFSVEIDPNEIDDARMDALAEAGLTRASIGVQDFDPDIQKTIGREQSFEITAQAVEMIRARGIASLNADILYGLPHQDNRRMAQSVQKLLALSPDRVALYGYAHVPWVAKRQVMIPSEALPTPEARLALFNTARDLFLADGYAEIGIDHFARPEDGLATARQAGQLRRNFQGYTDDQANILIGLG
ncbi:MAG: oxygen-independent coproporphyrinogen III oxidase, partial [Paracoccus sp. (in: a-proteobacteria)]